MRPTRRQVLAGAALAALPRRALAQEDAPFEPLATAGDVGVRKAIIWARAARAGRMLVEVADNPEMTGAVELRGSVADVFSDWTARAILPDPPSGRTMHYRVRFDGLLTRPTEPLLGSFRTAPAEGQAVRFAWGGDTCGQGWGIHPTRGLPVFATIAKHDPAFLLHCGDFIYADGPIRRLPPGADWQNVVADGVNHVAESLADFRGRYRYNLRDRHLRALLAKTPLICQWDDHEVKNNWWPGQWTEDPRYSQRDVDILARRARQAMFEYLPIATEGDRVYRPVHYGPLLDVFVLDCRSYRAPNGPNRQEAPSEATAYWGAEQIAWLKAELSASKATWKVIANDMPIGVLSGGEDGVDNASNTDGPVRGREFEIAEILSFIKSRGIRNTVWLTADVHFAAAILHDPTQAAYRDFDPFWEFIAGPLHAGNFGWRKTDDTFGTQMVYAAPEADLVADRPPSDRNQFFGVVDIDPASQAMTVALYNQGDERLHEVTIPAG